MGKKESSRASGTVDDHSLLVVCPLYPPHTGGLESHAAQFNEQLVNQGYVITVFTPQLSPQDAPQEVVLPGLTVFRFPAWEIIPNYPLPKLWQPRFWQQLAHVFKQPHRWVISRTRFFITSPLAGVLARLKGSRWMHIEHGSDFVHLHNPLARTLARLFDEVIGRGVFLSADVLVANSQASAAFIKRLAPRRQVMVIYRGVEKEKISALPAYSLTASTEVVVAYVGRLIDGKGVTDLFQAFATLTATHAKLLIIGDGPLRSVLKQLAHELGITSRVIFRGETPWAQAMSLLKTADIVVNPSYTEGLPTAVIEAAWCACAIVATNVGGTSEIVTHNHSGLLIPPGNVPQLASALRQLINNPTLRHTLGQQARHDVQTRFNWDTASASYQKLLL